MLRRSCSNNSFDKSVTSTDKTIDVTRYQRHFVAQFSISCIRNRFHFETESSREEGILEWVRAARESLDRPCIPDQLGHGNR